MNPRSFRLRIQGYERMPPLVARTVLTMNVPQILAAAARRERLRKWGLLAGTVAAVLGLAVAPRLSRAVLAMGAQGALLVVGTWAAIRLGMEGGR